MKISKTILLLILIVLFAGFLRFYQLSTIAPSLTWDEVAWAYNAYSLGLDGKDEFGMNLPYAFLESFGDFKPPFYAYLAILPVKLFGLTELAVRFPAALFGTLTVLVAYFLTRSIFYQSPLSKQYALTAAFLLAVSPWHIMLSRAAFEANVATFFLASGVWLFLEAMHKKRWVLILSILCFVCAFFTFNTARIVGPLLLIILTIAHWKKLWQTKKIVGLAVLVGFVFLLPTLSFFASPQSKLRFNEVNIFSDSKVVVRANQEIANDHNAWWSKILHNRRMAYATEYLNHYFDNLSPLFLFIDGDENPKFSIRSMGQMYLFEAPFLILGLLLLFRKREKQWWIIPLWLLIGIIPAATARETPHALRIESTLPTFQLLVAYGLVNAFHLMKKYNLARKVTVAFVVLLAFGNMVFFAENYFVHYAKKYSLEWQYGYKDAISYIGTVENNYDQIFITEYYGRPYIYMLYYKQYDPVQFRKEATVDRDGFGLVTVKAFNKYYFDRSLVDPTKKVLYFDIKDHVPSNAKVQKTFYVLDGRPVFVAYTL